MSQSSNPDQLAIISEIPADLHCIVHSPGGPLQRVPFGLLLAKLIKTDLVFQNDADLQADLAHPEDTVALTINDPDPLKNGWSRKTGASGAGGWDLFEQLAKAVRDDAEQSAATAANLISQASGLADPAAAHAVFGQLAGTPRLYGADPDKFYWLDALYFDFDGDADGDADRLRAILIQADDAAGTNGFTASEYFVSGTEEKSGKQTLMVPEANGSGVVLELPLDFGDGSPWPNQMYPGTGTFANAGFSPKTIVDTVSWGEAVDRRISSYLIGEDRRDEGPFVASVRDEKLRDTVSGAAGIFTEAGHRYGLSKLELNDFSQSLGYWRAQITVRDFESGVDVAQRSQFFYEDPTGKAIPLVLTQGTLPAYTGKIFAIEIAPTAAWNNTVRTYTLFAEAGFHSSLLHPTSEVESFLLEPPAAHEEVVVKAVGGEAPSLTAAQAPFYNNLFNDAVEADKFKIFPNSEIAHFAHRLRFLLADEAHDEELQGLVPLWHSIIQGRGMFNTRFWGNTAGKRIFESTWPCWKVDIAADQFANEYLDHIDNAGSISRLAAAGHPIQNAFLDQGWLRCWYRAHGADGSGGAPSCVGMGGSSYQRQRIVSSIFEQVSGADIPAMFIHNSAGSARGGYLGVERGSILRNAAGTAALQLIGTFGQSGYTEIFASADSTIAGGIKGNVTMVDSDPDMPALARQRWPFRVRGHVPDGVAVNDAKMRVLTLNPGTSISTGSGVAQALFGTGYDVATGDGEALTLDGSVQSLATKLSGLEGATMSLARSAVTPEAITIGNYAGMSEAQILAALNAQLTNFVIGTRRIDGDIGVEA